MRKCRQATIKEVLLFQHKYCESAKSRETLIHKFKVTVEAYEELPPWYSTFSADGSDIRFKDDIIMFCVRDFDKLIEYYPVFSAEEGLRLLSKWKMPVPPKMTAFGTHLAGAMPSDDNASFRSLIAYSRLYMLKQGKYHAKMAFGFNNLYKQLYDFPACEVSAEAVQLVNVVLGDYIHHSQTIHVENRKTLQKFIAYVTTVYSLLEFRNADFARLRKKLREAYPDEKINF